MRSYVITAAMLLLFSPALAVDGFNMPGSDYLNFNADSPLICRNSCGGDIRCQSWTWVKPGIQGPTGHCWLKNSVPQLVRDNCCNSGTGQSISDRDMKAEDHTNRPGLDFKNFETDGWAVCESACAHEERCAAWTHVKRGIQGPVGRCWLKTGVPNPVGEQNRISGVKFKSRPGRFD